MKKAYDIYIIHIFKIFFILISLVGLIAFPKEIGNGVKSGLLLLGDSIIPALFPFMVFASYIAFSPYSDRISMLLKKPAQKLFSTNGNGLTAVILGILGGYPIGAKTVAEYYQQGLLSANEAHRIIPWCVNPSPAFVITATGTFLLRNTKSGAIIYISVILASLTIGVFNRFIKIDCEKNEKTNISPLMQKDVFINSVASASKAMLAICGWVLTFSALCAGFDCLTDNEHLSLLIKSIAEVTNGCRLAAEEGLSLPLICAITSFGGFAVIFQVSPYLQICSYNLRVFICWRLLSAALSAFYCSLFIRLFPDAQSVYQVISVADKSFTVSHSISAAVILLITCVVLILEVDNKRKVW